ncbi:MAG TPA: FHA domain-containing protein [Pyrinomonadaceae bacterium]|nr:FHA domain-containing protein [Pyrinomonadaceae bacterium]
MLVCDKCSTRNADTSRFCDVCGAPLWLAGRSSGSLDKTNGNGSNGNSRQAAPSLASSGAQISAEHVSRSNLQPPQIHATLIIERGVSAGKKFALSSPESNIGRWDADGGVFPDVDLDSDDPEAKVSRRHARIVVRDGNYLIEDLGSTNGTFVNRGRRLAPGDRQPLKDGDEIIVGKTFLRFRVSK